MLRKFFYIILVPCINFGCTGLARKFEGVNSALRHLRHLRGLGIGNLKLSTVLIPQKKQNDFSGNIPIFNLSNPNSSYLRKIGETDRASEYS